MMEHTLKRKNIQPVGGEQGFTVMELMISLVVLTFGLVSIVGISAYVSKANNVSNHMSVLATAAQDQVDRLRKVVWTLGSDSDARLRPDALLTTTSSTSSQTTTSTQAQPYTYTLDPNNPHRATVANTPAGDLVITWQVLEGPGTTGDIRTVTITVKMAHPPLNMRDGYTVSTIIHRN